MSSTETDLTISAVRAATVEQCAKIAERWIVCTDRACMTCEQVRHAVDDIRRLGK